MSMDTTGRIGDDYEDVNPDNLADGLPAAQGEYAEDAEDAR